MTDRIEIKEVYSVDLAEFVKLKSKEEVRYILAIASIANEIQYITFNIDRAINTGDTYSQEVFFLCRLAMFRLDEAFKVIEGNMPLLKTIDAEAFNKYVDIKAKFKKEDRSLFKWLNDGVITAVRNSFVHCRLEESDFSRTAEKMSEQMSTIYSFKNNVLNNPELADINWVNFVFADDFYSNHFVICVDPGIDLADSEREDAVIGEITTELNEGLGIISALCSQVVSNYMRKHFTDFSEGFYIYSPSAKAKTTATTP